MPDDPAVNPGGLVPGGDSPPGSATVDWSKGGAEHFGGFKESLGDLSKDKSLEPIKDFHGLAKGYVESQKMIGRGIYLPREGATEEERKKSTTEIMDKLRKANIIEGTPDSPDKYEIKMPAKNARGEEFRANEPLVKSFKETAHKLEIPPSKVQGLFDWYLNLQAETEAVKEKNFNDVKTAYKKESGGLYIRNNEAARRAIFKYMGEDGDDIMTRITELDANLGLKLVRAFSQIGDPLLEDGIVTGNLAGMPTLESINEKINVMMNDKKHPLNDVSAPGHKAALAEYDKLNGMLAQLQVKSKTIVR